MGGEFMILLSNYLTSSYPELWPHVLIFSHSREFRAIGVSSPVILAFFLSCNFRFCAFMFALLDLKLNMLRRAVTLRQVHAPHMAILNH